MIDDLIDISRIVTGKLRVLTEPLDLRGSVESAVDAIRASAELAGITLRLHLPVNPCLIKGDRDRLQQIVWNLLSNAVKFAPGGDVNVELTGVGDHLELSVTDNGIGIAPEFIDKVFDRFRQADASVTREHGGLGIGRRWSRSSSSCTGARFGPKVPDAARAPDLPLRSPATTAM